MSNPRLNSPSLEQIESLAVEQYKKDLRPQNCALQKLLAKRWLKLKKEFIWNNKSAEKLLWVNNQLTQCLHKAKAEAEKAEQTLKNKIKNGDSFIDDFEIEISVQPFILEPSSDGYQQEPQNNIYEVLNASCEELKISLSELKRDGNIFLSTNLNWADLLPDFQNFTSRKHHIGYAIHTLYEHCYWSIQDILKISEFWAEVHIKITHFSEKLYAGYVNDEHTDLISENKQ